MAGFICFLELGKKERPVTPSRRDRPSLLYLSG